MLSSTLAIINVFYKIRDNNFSFALIFSEKSFSPLEKDMNYGRLYFPGF